jgi:hypothetical protein
MKMRNVHKMLENQKGKPRSIYGSWGSACSPYWDPVHSPKINVTVSENMTELTFKNELINKMGYLFYYWIIK